MHTAWTRQRYVLNPEARTMIGSICLVISGYIFVPFGLCISWSLQMGLYLLLGKLGSLGQATEAYSLAVLQYLALIIILLIASFAVGFALKRITPVVALFVCWTAPWVCMMLPQYDRAPVMAVIVGVSGLGAARGSRYAISERTAEVVWLVALMVAFTGVFVYHQTVFGLIPEAVKQQLMGW